ncbi:MAG: hypothetical protein DRI48_09905, partial [Chloroflexi bacterium]
MNSHKNNLLGIIATGFVVLLLFSLALFLGRIVCETLLIRDVVLGGNDEIRISPIPLIPPEIENDPNVDVHSEGGPSLSSLTSAGTFQLGSWDLLEEIG